MRPDNRERFEKVKALAKSGDELAIASLRLIAIRLCCTAPPAALIRVVEAFNDAFVDEQIEYAKGAR
jgi:hypothetical protein